MGIPAREKINSIIWKLNAVYSYIYAIIKIKTARYCAKPSYPYLELRKCIFSDSIK